MQRIPTPDIVQPTKIKIEPPPDIISPIPRKKLGSGIGLCALELSAEEKEEQQSKQREKDRPKRKYVKKADKEKAMADATKLLSSSPSLSLPPAAMQAIKVPIQPAHNPKDTPDLPFATAKPIGWVAPQQEAQKPPAAPLPPKPIAPSSSGPSAVSYAAPPYKPPLFIKPKEVVIPDDLALVRRSDVARNMFLCAALGIAIGVGAYFWFGKLYSAVSDGVANTPASVAQKSAKAVAKRVAAKSVKLVP